MMLFVDFIIDPKRGVKIQSWQSDDVAEGCGRCADCVSLFTI